MNKLTLSLLLTIILAMSMALLLTACPEPEAEPAETSTAPEEPNPAPCDKNPKATGWCVTTIVGDGTYGHKDGIGTDAKFWTPNGIALSPDGNTLYVADENNHRIRKLTIAGGIYTVSTIAGDGNNGGKEGTGTDAQFSRPSGIALSPDGNTLYVADTGSHRIRKIELPSGTVTTIVNSGLDIAAPQGIALSPDANTLYVANTSHHRISKVALADNKVTIIAGSDAKNTTAEGDTTDGTGTAARFYTPMGIAVVEGDKNTLYVADTYNHRIRKIELPSGIVTTIAGSIEGNKDGIGTDAQFNKPRRIVAVSATLLYVADTGNHRIRKIELPSGTVTTIAGSTKGNKDDIGTAAQFKFPIGIAAVSNTLLYVADANNNIIRKLEYKKVEEAKEPL